jgi:hypothetical protein
MTHVKIGSRASARRRTALALSATVAAVLACGTLATGSAFGKAPVLQFSSGPSETQAGSHPDVATSFEVGNQLTQTPLPRCACDAPKDITVHVPAGVIANPHVVSECLPAQLQEFGCPSDSQVGLIVLRTWINSSIYFIAPLYRTTTAEGQAGRFAFLAPLAVPVPEYLVVSARTGGDYGLDIKSTGINHLLLLERFSTIFWGVPADPVHDALRWRPEGVEDFALGCLGSDPTQLLLHSELPPICFTVEAFESAEEKPPAPSSLPERPFTSSPTTCAGDLTATIDSLAYDDELDFGSAVWPGTTGCDLLSFNPSLSASPTTSEADSPSGLEIDLNVPQTQSAHTLSPSEIKGTRLELPKGLSLNPNAADGKTSCSDAAANLTNEQPAECPEFSKIGTATVDSSALPGPIPGALYLGDPQPGNRYRVVLAAGGFGTNVKFIGSVSPDPQTGQLVVSFQNLPQAPFQELNIHLFGSERGLLATPTQCGTYAVHTTFTPWAAQLSDQTATQFFKLESGPGGAPCPSAKRPFDPGMEAASVDNTAGIHAPFSFNLTRSDGDQDLAGVSVTAPPGFSATLRGIPYCPESAIAHLQQPGYTGLAEQASSACPAASQIGTAVAAAGSGTRPLYVNGKVYLAGPYKGAPLSLVIVTPAVSGPYDLGNVVVRSAIQFNPATGRVTAVSDPLPQIIEGVPLRLRSVRVNLDRPKFALNPTNCERFSTDAIVTGDQGSVVSESAPYQVANCRDLGFNPKFSLRLSGGLGRLGHPAIHAVLTANNGDANLHDVAVTLPKGEQLENKHIGSPCVKADFEAGTCPPSSEIGQAQVTTPLLDHPLEGTVFLRASRVHKLPDLVLDLKGQVNVELTGRVDSVNGRLRTTFESTPDVPVSSVSVNLDGGKKGLLVNERSLCSNARKAAVGMVGQNGKVLDRRVALQTSCGSSSRGKRHGHRHSRKAGR